MRGEGTTLMSFKAQYEEMMETAKRMRGNKQEIDSRLSDTKGCVANLVASGFVTQEASVKFDEVNNDFNKNATELMENLNQLSLWLDNAIEALRRMDTELAGSLAKK